MTKENAIRNYKHILEMIERPTGVNSAERNSVRNLAKISKAKMEEHFRTAKKYKNDADIKALLGEKKNAKE
jgi:hypothetical protein